MKETIQLETYLYQGVRVDVTHTSVHSLFERQVGITPNRPAVTFDKVSISYEQLNDKANQLAYTLLRSGINKDTIVGVLLERGINTIVAMLAILKAGGAFLVIDIDCPIERINFILQDSKLSSVVVNSVTENFLSQHFFDLNIELINFDKVRMHSAIKLSNPLLSISGNNLAYVIYTSGTTGTPKGVLVEHRGVVNTLLNQIEILKIIPEDKVLCAAPFLFDASIWEIGGALLAGAHLYLTTQQERKSIKKLSRFIKEHKISLATLTPSILRLLPSKSLTSLRCLVSAGETCTMDLLKKVSESCVLFNAYGPTEVSICATIAAIKKSGANINVGTPLKNVTAYVLKDDLSPVLQGEVGALYVGGIGLARGYLHDLLFTNARFINDPFQCDVNSKIYNTGDLVRINDSGVLEYVGRKDDEIKICGNRVNLNEIQRLLMLHPHVRNSIVKAVNSLGKTRIIAIIETKDNLLNFVEVRNYLQHFLPVYMLPNKLIIREEFPLSFNGKVGSHYLHCA